MSDTTSTRSGRVAAPPGCLSRIFRIFVLLLVAGGIVVVVDGLKVELPIGQPGTPARGETIGVIHIHTNRSHDGGGDLSEVLEAARWADLSFVAITDHNTALPEDIAGKDKSSVLVIGGEEVSTPDGHVLVLGVKEGWREGVPKETHALLAAAKKAGGTRILAHPLGKSREWGDWDASYDAMEVWNADAAWRANNPLELLSAALLYTVNPDLALTRLAKRPEESLAKWDALTQSRKVASICAADAHSHIPVFKWSIEAPGYLRVFKLARQHVLLDPGPDGRYPRDAASIVRAIRDGRSFCALDGLAVASGFVNRVEGEGLTAGPGQSVPWAPGATLRVSTPQGSGKPRIKVFKDGVETFDKRGWRLDEQIPGPGVYRTEVWLRQPGITGGQRWMPWILSNPIYVTGGTPSPLPRTLPAAPELEPGPSAPSSAALDHATPLP